MEIEDLTKRYEIVKKYTSGERNFASINLNEANLSRINLSHTNLSGASLFITNLSAANLSEADLTGANLNVARLSSANLTKAILNNAILNVANLVRADLTEAQLVSASLVRGELVRVELSRANLTNANLSNADLREAKFTEANLTKANLSGANLRSSSGIGANLEGANLHGADLSKADLQRADLSNTELRQANLTQANLSGSDLRGANLRWADLTGADLSGADLRDSKLSGATLLGTNLSQANLNNSSLVHADLTQANLIRADWENADLSGATLTGTKLYEVPRFDLKIDGIICEWVDLSPDGDLTQVVRFKTDEVKNFFSQRPPIVKIIIDGPLDQEANLVLANTYYQIAQIYPIITRPPSIDVNYRRTTLVFRLAEDWQLFPVACLAIMPFSDALITQKNIINIVKQLQSADLDKNRLIQLRSAMNEAINKINELKNSPILPHNNSGSLATKFFVCPTQVVLSKSKEKSLILQANYGFGRGFNPSMINNNNQQLNSPKLNLPTVTQVVDFLNF